MFGKKKKDKTLEKVNLSYQQMFYTNALSIEAIVNVLERKGVLEKKEILSEIKKLGEQRKQKMEEINETLKKNS